MSSDHKIPKSRAPRKSAFQFGKLGLTKFFIMYILRLIFENGDEGSQEIINDPKVFVRELISRKCFGLATEKLLVEIITDLNAEIDQLGEDFDYRGKLRDEEWCKKLAYLIATTHKKLVDRNRLESFRTLYDTEIAQQGHTH